MATAAEVFRDYVTDGVPSSGANKPKKSEIRGLLRGYEDILNASIAAGASRIFVDKAAIDASLSPPAHTLAWVILDPVAENNGIYRKIGAEGAGSWTRVADLPYSFIAATDVGGGTPDAIQATSPLPVSSSALVLLNIYEANTASPVTVSFNGGAALTVKSNSGNDIAPGGLQAGMLVIGRVYGSTFRIVTDQVSSAIVAAAEAAQVLTEDARDETLAAIGSGMGLSVLSLFGAAGNGSINSDGTGSGIGTNDTAAIQNAINTLPVGAVIDGLGKTYKVTSSLALKAGQTLRNIKIDASQMASGDILLEATGTEGLPVNLTASAAAGVSSISVASVAGLAVNDLIFISSTALFYSLSGGGMYGEWARIKSIVGTTITLFDALNLTYSPGSAAQIVKMSTLKNITLENVMAVGGGAGLNHYMGEFWRCENLRIINCHGDLFDNRNIQIRKTYDAKVIGGSYRRSTVAGLSYGVAIVEGCFNVEVDGVKGEDLRHLVTVGGNAGVNRTIKAHHCVAMNMREAGLDAHPMADDVDFSHNTVVMAPGATGSALICQGPNFRAIGNRIFNAQSFGIWHQQCTDVLGSSYISGNEVFGNGGVYGIEVQTQTAATGQMNGVTVADNILRGFTNLIRIYAIGATISGAAVKGNMNQDNPTGFGIQLRALAGKFVYRGVVSDNTINMGGGNAVELISADVNSVARIAVTGNSLSGNGSGTGVLGTNSQSILTDGNVITGFATKTSVAGTGSVLGTNL